MIFLPFLPVPLLYVCLFTLPAALLAPFQPPFTHIISPSPGGSLGSESLSKEAAVKGIAFFAQRSTPNAQRKGKFFYPLLYAEFSLTSFIRLPKGHKNIFTWPLINPFLAIKPHTPVPPEQAAVIPTGKSNLVFIESGVPMQRLRFRLLVSTLVLAFFFSLAQLALAQEKPKKPTPPPPPDIPTITLKNARWFSVRDSAEPLGYKVRYNTEKRSIELSRGERNVSVHPKGGTLWWSGDHRTFLPVRWLGKLGYTVQPGTNPKNVIVTLGERRWILSRQPKSIAVNLQRQMLFAREGKVVVYRFPTSTGKEGHETPNGDYKVLRKIPLYISKTYPEPTGGAKMPHAIWFAGGYYIHGYHSVPGYTASHGCVRLAIADARTLYHWTPIGAKVRIYRTATYY